MPTRQAEATYSERDLRVWLMEWNRMLMQYEEGTRPMWFRKETAEEYTFEDGSTMLYPCTDDFVAFVRGKAAEESKWPAQRREQAARERELPGEPSKDVHEYDLELWMLAN
jgi:hypothetical protein